MERKSGSEAVHLKPLNPDYEHVATVFQHLTKPFPPDCDRGGIVRSGKKPYFDTPNTSTIHNVQMTFTPEQRTYVINVLGILGTLADGKLIGNEEEIAPLEQRIAQAYARNITPEYRFADSCKDAILTLLDDFQRYYPSLMPALHAMFEVAGAEGIDAAVDDCSPFLQLALEGEMTRDNQKEMQTFFTRKDRDIKYFIQTRTDDTQIYEVWCSGKAFADKITEKAIEGALTIAERVHDPAFPLPPQHLYTDEEIYTDEIREHVRELADITAQECVERSSTT